MTPINTLPPAESPETASGKALSPFKLDGGTFHLISVDGDEPWRTHHARAADLAAVLAAMPEDELTALAESLPDAKRERLVYPKTGALVGEIARHKARADQYEQDWIAAKYDFGVALGKAVNELAECREELKAATEACADLRNVVDIHSDEADRLGEDRENLMFRISELEQELAAERLAQRVMTADHARLQQLFGTALQQLQALGEHSFDLDRGEP